jgi:hypothetical protein
MAESSESAAASVLLVAFTISPAPRLSPCRHDSIYDSLHDCLGVSQWSCRRPFTPLLRLYRRHHHDHEALSALRFHLHLYFHFPAASAASFYCYRFIGL